MLKDDNGKSKYENIRFLFKFYNYVHLYCKFRFKIQFLYFYQYLIAHGMQFIIVCNLYLMLRQLAMKASYTESLRFTSLEEDLDRTRESIKLFISQNHRILDSGLQVFLPFDVLNPSIRKGKKWRRCRVNKKMPNLKKRFFE